MLKLDADDRPIVIASLFVLVILALGSAYTLTTQGNLAFLNPGYLLQQLQVGARGRTVHLQPDPQAELLHGAAEAAGRAQQAQCGR